LLLSLIWLDFFLPRQTGCHHNHGVDPATIFG
jgi:hypothetical protein